MNSKQWRKVVKLVTLSNERALADVEISETPPNPTVHLTICSKGLDDRVYSATYLVASNGEQVGMEGYPTCPASAPVDGAYVACKRRLHHDGPHSWEGHTDV